MTLGLRIALAVLIVLAAIILGIAFHPLLFLILIVALVVFII